MRLSPRGRFPDGSRGAEGAGSPKGREGASPGVADGFRRLVPGPLPRGGMLQARIPRGGGLINDTDQSFNFFIAEIGLNIQESLSPFFTLTWGRRPSGSSTHPVTASLSRGRTALGTRSFGFTVDNTNTLIHHLFAIKYPIIMSFFFFF